MSVLHIYQFKLRGDVTLEESDAWQPLLSNFHEVDGLKGFSWALQEENSAFVSIVADFVSLAAHQQWNSSKQQATTELVKSLCSDEIYSNVVAMSSDAGPSLEAKTVELVSWIYPAEKVDEELKTRCVHGFKKFSESILASPWSSGGMAAGWSTTTFNYHGKVSRRFTGLIGWQSVEAHYECKKTPTFTDHIHWLRNGDAVIEMVHYSYSRKS